MIEKVVLKSKVNLTIKHQSVITEKKKLNSNILDTVYLISKLGPVIQT